MLDQSESMPRATRRRRAGGFTLLELMLTVMVLGVLAVVAVPSFNSTIRINRIVSDNNELVTALTMARSEAIKRANRVTVCRSADQLTCATNGGWEQGWIVFVDTANFGTVDAGEQVLRSWEAAATGVTIRTGANFDDWVSFVPSGETRAQPANIDAFRVCGSTADIAEGRTVSVGLIGYASTQRGTATCP